MLYVLLSKGIVLGFFSSSTLEVGLINLGVDLFLILPPSIDKNEGQKPLAQL